MSKISRAKPFHGYGNGIGPNGELLLNGSPVSGETLPDLWFGSPVNSNDMSQFTVFEDHFLNPASATASEYHAYTET